MAYSKIQYNGSQVTLAGVKWWNGTEFEQVKGIKLNGEILVDFSTTELDWSDYVTAYNNVWDAQDPQTLQQTLAKMTAENEFAVVRSRWMLYNRIELFNNAGITSGDYRLFNFNSDGKIYVKQDDNILNNWQALKDNGVSVITMTIAPGSTYANNALFAYRHLTGLPLVFKTDENTFQATTILDGSLDNIVKTGDAYKLNLGNLSSIVDYNGNALTSVDVVTAIQNQLGITVASSTSSTIDLDIANVNKWGSLELLDALSNVYLEGFGPYGAITEYDDNDEEHPYSLYYLEPNTSFEPQDYWSVPNDQKIPIEIEKPIYYKDTSGCDVYILTAWGNTMIDENVSVVDNSYYYAQGNGDDGNAENEYTNIVYWDISSFAGTQYPNFLCYMSMVFKDFTPETIYNGMDIANPKWIGVNTNGDLIGQSSAAIVFPSDSPYDVTGGTPPSVSDITAEYWSNINGLSDLACNFAINQYVETDYNDGSVLAPATVAKELLNEYDNSFPTKFLLSSSSAARQYPLKLKMRSYPATAFSSIGGGIDTSYWYLNAYDPYNVGGYYPVKKTTTANAGILYNTTVNYTTT